jgi:hypothetical protein
MGERLDLQYTIDLDVAEEGWGVFAAHASATGDRKFAAPSCNMYVGLICCVILCFSDPFFVAVLGFLL